MRVCCVIGGIVPSKMKLNKLCKFCDVQSTSCNGLGICHVNCSITAICEQNDEVCVAIWYVTATVFNYYYYYYLSILFIYKDYL